MKISSAEYAAITPMVKCNGAGHCTVDKCPNKIKHIRLPMNCNRFCQRENGVTNSTCMEVPYEGNETRQGV